MNAPHIQGPEGSDCFPNMVAFKWLRAGISWRVDLPRLRSDKTYIEECLQRALRSDSELLQKCGVEMLGLLDLPARLGLKQGQPNPIP